MATIASEAAQLGSSKVKVYVTKERIKKTDATKDSP